MTSTDVAVIDQSRIDALAAQLGMDPNANSSGSLPQLKTNSDSEDANDKPLPFGTFYVPGMDQVVYNKTVKFRPLLQTYQMSEYDALNNKMACKTVENTSHSQELIDTRGTLRCGRPAPSVWREMTPEEKKPYEAVTSFVNLRGLVSYKGNTQDGEEAEVDHQPVIIRLKGTNYSAFSDCIGSFGKNIPKGRKIWDYWFDINLKKMKNGSVTYFEWLFTFDPLVVSPLDMQTFDTIEAFASDVANGNKAVQREYDAALTKRGAESLQGSYKDLDDDLPF